MVKIEEKIILAAIKMRAKNSENLNSAKRLVLRSQKCDHFPNTAELYKAYHNLLKNNKIKANPTLESVLRKRAVRTLSGVTIVTVLTKPFPCPGKCIYCPTEVRMPKSYISDEPAAARALSLNFDPYEQVRRRLQTLQENGHPTDKIELIIKGGTWNFYPLAYQYWFILRCFLACNRSRAQTDEKMSLEKIKKLLTVAQIKNETAPYRIIGLTLETRPDFINNESVITMREMGCTRVEIGVQTIDDKILEKIKRGCKTEAVRNATKLLKQYGYKVDYHLMPQLPGATAEKDLKMLRAIFSDSDFRPDMIKIYPCTVVKNSELNDWVKEKKFKPYSDKKLLDVLTQFKTEVPRYVRISRIIRDIPARHITAGNIITNLRQVIQQKLKTENKKCNCLRCREIGHNQDQPQGKIKMFVEKYDSSGGTEYFLSFEDTKRNVVFAFCRLRVDKSSPVAPAIIRELHTYGQTIEIGEKDKDASQHKGLGKKLMAQAMTIAKKQKCDKIAVIAGVGVRGYYRKLGFRQQNTYMIYDLI